MWPHMGRHIERAPFALVKIRVGGRLNTSWSFVKMRVEEKIEYQLGYHISVGIYDFDFLEEEIRVCRPVFCSEGEKLRFS